MTLHLKFFWVGKASLSLPDLSLMLSIMYRIKYSSFMVLLLPISLITNKYSCNNSRRFLRRFYTGLWILALFAFGETAQRFPQQLPQHSISFTVSSLARNTELMHRWQKKMSNKRKTSSVGRSLYKNVWNEIKCHNVDNNYRYFFIIDIFFFQ